MDAFGLVVNVIATIETVYKIINFFEEIKSSGVDCHEYLSEARSSCILLLQLRERLQGNAVDGHKVQPWSRHLQSLEREDGVLQHYKSDMEQLSNILVAIRSKRFRRIFAWHREKGKIEGIFKKIERHKSSIQIALSHDQFVEAHVETIASLGATETEQQEKVKILDWVQKSAVNYELMQRDYSAAAQEGTGQVFLTSETFRGEDHDHRKLLFAILSQFLSRSGHMSKLVKDMFDNRAKTPPKVEDVMSVLEDFIRSSRCSFLLLDALDEFYNDDGARSRFLNLIRRLQDAGDLRVMMTARPHLSDDPAIWSDATIQIVASDTDLHSYLDQKIYSLKDVYNTYEVEDILDNLSRGPNALEQAYEDAIERIDHQQENRQRYARLTISWMVQCLRPMTPAELQHAVTKPEHLERRPTASSLVKIDTLISFCAGLITLDRESNVIRFIHYTTQEYFTKERLAKWLPSAGSDTALFCTIYLMNPSLTGALEFIQKEWELKEAESLKLQLEGTEMSKGWRSVTRTARKTSEGPKRPRPREVRKLPQGPSADWPFLDYCRNYWGPHCLDFQKRLETLLLQFLTGPAAKIIYKGFGDLWDPRTSARASYFWNDPSFALAKGRLLSPISICSRWGLHHLAGKLLDQGYNTSVAPMPPYDHTLKFHVAVDEPFLLACQYGHSELARLLLERTSISEDLYYKAFEAADKEDDIDTLDLIITHFPFDAILFRRIALCSSIDHSRIKENLYLRGLDFTLDTDFSPRPLLQRAGASFWVECLFPSILDVNKVYPADHEAWERAGSDAGYDDYVDCDEWTPLEHAAVAGCLENTRVLLKQPEIRAFGRKGSGYKVLELASRSGEVEIVRLLLFHASKTPEIAERAWYSVYQALCGISRYWAKPSTVPILKSLLEYEHLKLLSFDQFRTFIETVLKEHREIIEAAEYTSGFYEFKKLEFLEVALDLMLHHSGIDFLRRDGQGRTLLQDIIPRDASHYTRRLTKNPEIPHANERLVYMFGMLLRHPSFEFPCHWNPVSDLARIFRCVVRDVEVDEPSTFCAIVKCQMILEDTRYDPDIPDEAGRTALSHVSEHGLVSLTKTLLQHSLVNINSRDQSGRTPLSYAAGNSPYYKTRHQAIRTLQILLGNDDIRKVANSPDQTGMTPLMYACRHGQAGTAPILLNIPGTDVNFQDDDGRTPLIHVLQPRVRYDRHEVLSVLLEAPGIAVNIRDKGGRSAIFYALSLGRAYVQDMSLLLQQKGLDLSGILDMRDDNGQALNGQKVLENMECIRKSRHGPLERLESERLDLIESLFSTSTE
ncbi:hypothetical protein Daus18300_004435 [Diaporthe australafricana]|uniref:GPI inositol-deacylase winged helix domain-containing protein n=1 Tax=Diaporthe australafricana TaxID=127596 RepID=A0ABR3X8K2_9PEZI